MVIKYQMEPGELKDGYFYSVTCAREDDLSDFEAESPTMVQSVEPMDEVGYDLLYLEPVFSHEVYWNACPHQEGVFCIVHPVLKYSSPKEVGNMSWYREGPGIVCKEELAIRLLKSPLLGIVVQRPEFWTCGGYPKPKDWYLVQGVGPSARKRRTMTPEPYKCWNCKNEPLCPDCGFLPPTCPVCGVNYKIPDHKWDGKDESKLVMYGCSPRIDVKAWDGSDYCGTVITHRMLQFLLSCHAHPFRALPIPVDVKGATAEELKRLEIARTPI
jgi:hypothetical protein